MGTSEFHGKVDVQMDLCICQMKSFIRNFCSPHRTVGNVNFLHKNLLKPQIVHSLRCSVETSTSTSIKNILWVLARFAYIL